MILTEARELTNPDNVYARAGKKQEDAVAFYLRRAFGSADDVFVFNDLMLNHEGERAQIDHLIVHTFGFVIIESKSITGEVKVNSQGEWSRSYKGQWSGMPSPIIQAQLQGAILQSLLKDNASKLLDKLLMGLVQAGFGARDLAIYCAVSNNAILHRENMPKKIHGQVVKAEALVEILKKKCSKVRGYLSTVPDFKLNELKNIAEFLLLQNCRPDLKYKEEVTLNAVDRVQEIDSSSNAPVLPEVSNLSVVKFEVEVLGVDEAQSKVFCKNCAETKKLTPSSGKFGYYLVCGNCGKNTPLKHVCLECKKHSVKISKSGDVYSAICPGGHEYRVV